MRELPLLRPKLLNPHQLQFATLVIAVYDHDLVGSDDPIGVALVPLAPPPSVPIGATSYEITVNEPLVHGNITAGAGHIHATLQVSFGEALEDALGTAKAEGAGESIPKSRKKWLCC